MKFKLNKGWTKKRMLETLLSRNNGTAAVNDTGTCVYEAKDKNHCAVGCFIPEGHPAMATVATVKTLLWDYPELQDAMPLDAEGLSKLQQIHDSFAWSKREREIQVGSLSDYAEKKTTHAAFRKFVREEVEV